MDPRHAIAGCFRTAARLALSLLLLLGACTRGEEGKDESGATGRGSTPASRPNVLLIITDDQRVGSLSVVPQLRKWFRRGGTEFQPGFVTTPLCCPSRASIFSGKYMHNHGVTTNLHARALDQDQTVQAYLQKAGYRTGLVGKFLNAWPPSLDPPFFDYYVVSSKFPYHEGTWNLNGRERQISTYSTTFIAERSLRFLKRASETEDPWFLTIATIAPHGPAEPEARYENTPVPLWRGNPAVLDNDLAGKPPFLGLEVPNLARARALREQQLRTLMSVDDLIGRVHRQLESSGDIQNTLVFFISDNGMQWQEHGISNKTLPYTSSVQVPFFMSWPAGSVPVGADDRMAANIDIAPTILDAAGIERERSASMDGRSLVRRWRRTELLLEYQVYQKFDTPSWASLRTRDSQYIQYRDEAGEVRFEEYYDLDEDPWQLENLLAADATENVAPAEDLRRRLERYRRCVGRECP